MMKRPLCVVGTAYAAATWLAFLFDWKAAAIMAALFFGAAAVTLAAPRAPRWLCVSLLAAAVAAGMSTAYHVRQTLPAERMEGKTVRVEGLVTAAEALGGSATYTVKARFPDGELRNQTIHLRVYGGGGVEFFPGDMLGGEARITLPASTNWETYYRSQGIGVIAVSGGGLEERELEGYRADRFFLDLRRRMEDNVYGCLSGEVADVVSAMVLGMQDNVSAELYTQINRSGVSHLLAVSGLHLSVITSFVLLGLRRLRLGERACCVFALAAALAFLLLVGPRASLVRAFVMTAVMLAARILSRKSDSLTSLCLAVLICCVFRPYWTLGRGMWLSVFATLGILLYGQKWSEALTGRIKTGNPVIDRVLSPLATALGISAAAYLFTAPLLLVYNGWISLAAPLSNLLVTPFVLPLMASGILCSLLGPGGLLMGIVSRVCGVCCRCILIIAGFTAELPLAATSLDQGYKLIWLAGAVAGTGALLCLRADGRLVRAGAALCALTFCVGSFTASLGARNTVELAVIERCGVAVLLRDGEAVLLGAPTRYNVGQLSKYLRYRNVKRIGAVVAPDYGNQVDTALTRLAEEFGVGCVLGPDDGYVLGQLEMLLGEKTPVYSAGYATVEVLGGVAITFPPGDGVLRVTAGEETVCKHAGTPEGEDPHGVCIGEDGLLFLPKGRATLVEPVGGYLFGERRLELRLS